MCYIIEGEVQYILEELMISILQGTMIAHNFIILILGSNIDPFVLSCLTILIFKR